MDSWLKMFSPLLDVRMPAAGDVQMDYSPWTNWGWYSPRAGNPQMEDAIYRHVARPGKQLGKIIDAIQALKKFVADLPPELCQLSVEQQDAFEQFEQLATDIERKQNEVRQDAELAAGEALDRLAGQDAKRFRRLIQERYDAMNEDAP